MPLFLRFLVCAHAVLSGWLICIPAYGQERQEPGTLLGHVYDTETGNPVTWVQLLLEEAGRSTISHQDGSFRFPNVAAGTYTLKAFRIGYEATQLRVDVVPEDTVRVTLHLPSSPIVTGGITIEGRAENMRADDLGEAVVSLSDRSLRQNLSTTIAETLEGQPGIRMRSMGPAPARPVLRGLGGERLLVLEDGERTGDLSASSTDHAVTIEPLTASRIEVIRGPASLLYGSNAQGGVVNVARHYIPTNTPEKLHIEASTQAESVNRGLATGVSAQAPVGKLVVRGDASYRNAQNVHTPAGELGNTNVETYNASLGTSFRHRHGYVGVAGSWYDTAYGIPGGFVGAHPNGVNIEIERRHVEARAEYLPHIAVIPRIEANYTYSWYFHQEFEAVDLLGVEFGVLAYHGKVIARTQNLGPFQRGAFGIWGQFRDYKSGGINFTPNSVQESVALFGFQEWQRDKLTAQVGLRADARRVTPEEERTSRIIGFIEERTFRGWSGAANLTWDTGTWHVGGSLLRSLRMPTLEELYSEGPHLAAYSFEVGDPRLGTETGLGFEVNTGLRSATLAGQVSLFYNRFTSYIYPRNTGEINFRLLLPLYQVSGAEAEMYGVEAAARVALSSHLELNSHVGWVEGTFTDTNEPMPWIPPLNGSVGLTYRWGAFTLNGQLRGATAQTRLGPFEERTGGYVIADAFVQYHVSRGGLLHTFDLGIKNLTNTEYRDHLSRVKSIMPEPGFNLKLLYKVYL